MKKLLSLVLALAIVVSGLTMISTLAEGEQATGVINGNAEDTTGANWGVIHGGEVTIVEDPDDATNHVAKFIPSGAYHSPFISLNNALDGAGNYTISFRVKAVEAGKTGEFLMCYASANHGGIEGVGATYQSCAPDKIEITDEWTTYEGSFNITQAWLDGLKTLSGVSTSGAGLSGATPETIGIRIDGANGAFADPTGYFAYYIDDVKVEKVEFEGVKITLDTIVTGSNYYARAASGSAGFTTADVVSGKIERTYEVYNDSDEEVTFWLRYQGGENQWTDLKDESASVTNTIPAKSKAIYKLSFAVDANGQVYDENDALAPLANTNLRAEFPNKGEDSCAAGAVLYIRAIDKESDPIYDLVFAGSGIVLTRAVDLPDYGVATPVPATPAPTHAINGDAEGTDTSVWGTMHGSGNTVTLIPEPGNTSNHVAHFVPGTYNYATVFYDITNVITGPGTYNVSFRIKAADAANSGSFELWLTSKQHMAASQVKDLLGEDAHFDNTFVALDEATVDVDGDWATYEGTITVEQEFLDMLAALETAGKANAKSVGLRICGSKDAFADGTWAYYLDDITVAKEGGEGEEAPKEPTGIEYEATEEVTSADQSLHFVGKKGAFSAANVKDDELTVKYQVKNTGEEAMGIKLELQALVGGKWVAPAAGEVVTIEPGEIAWLEYTCEVSDGKVEISGEDVAISELFIRFDVVNGDGGGTVAAGTKFIVYASGAEYEALKAVATRPGWSSDTVYSAPSQEGGDMLPVALIATVVVAFVALAVVAKKRKED